MARNSPNPGQKILYFLLISISISILYVDIKTDTFSGIKNNFKSVKISSKYILKSITVDPVTSLIDQCNLLLVPIIISVNGPEKYALTDPVIPNTINMITI